MIEPLPVAFLGLVFDPIGLSVATQRIRAACESRNRLVFATPNVNFLAGASRNDRFRQAVLRCGMNVADGMPVVWAARLAGIAIPERVAGSTLVDALRSDSAGRPLRIFFFGGDPGVAQAACAVLEREAGGLVAAGALDPGRQGIESMSTPAIHKFINSTCPDILCVSLGAMKGHEWIEKNEAALDCPVISHLGAVVNFVAGTVRRAPVIVQRLGIEWLWRIFQEPRLWRRYVSDGGWLLRALWQQVLPLAIRRFLPKTAAEPLHIEQEQGEGGVVMLRLSGGLSGAELARHGNLWEQRSCCVDLDLSGLSGIDSAGVAWLALLKHRLCPGGAVRIASLPPASIRLAVSRHGMKFLFNE